MYDDDAEIQYLRNFVKTLKADINERAFEADSIRNEIDGFAKENKTELQMAMEIEAVECAIEKIKESVLMIQKDTADILNRNVSEIYSRITNGKYSNIKVDEEFNVFLNTKDKLISGSRISKGARDELDFAIRLAVSDMFFTEEKMPVIIDDMFAMYDDKRVASAIEVLSEMNTQVIIFTCHKRERKILESKGIIHNYIELTE